MTDLSAPAMWSALLHAIADHIQNGHVRFSYETAEEILRTDGDAGAVMAYAQVLIAEHLRRSANEPESVLAHPPVVGFRVEGFDADMWNFLGLEQDDLERARERREANRGRYPDMRYRIVRREEIWTVVESE